MSNTITYKEVLELDNYILIDVRTPKEFTREPIIGAINIPVLLDDEFLKHLYFFSQNILSMKS